MSEAVLGRLDRHDRLWPVVAASAVVHAGLLLAAALARPAPAIDLAQKPIMAKLVRLGEERPREWLPRNEASPPPPTAPATVPIPGAAPRAPDARAPGPERQDRLSSVLDRMRRDKALGERSRFGSPSGSPLGESSEGEGDSYLALVQQALHSNYRVPATLSEEERQRLLAVVVLNIQPDGRISGFRFEKKSGRPEFDEALERAVRQTRLPPPPPETRARYRDVGLGVRFHM